tara:strand:- start:58363 stop:58794 length:432 start_codon:yes stop_codon:yes gene_type:complete
MGKEEFEDYQSKWKPLFDNHNKWESNYFETGIDKSTIDENTLNTLNFLPIAQRVAAQTIGQDLVSVMPMSYVDEEEVEKIKERIFIDNRNYKIDSIVEGTTYKEVKLEDDIEYKELVISSSPTAKLMYLDFKYGNDDNDNDEE